MWGITFWATLVDLRQSSITSLNYVTGTFVYMFIMSKEASLAFGCISIFIKSSVSWGEFLTLKAFGNWIIRGSKLVKNFSNLYAGAFLQFTVGLTGYSCLWIFISPHILGGDGFRFISFCLWSSLIVLQSLIHCLRVLWYILVRSLGTVLKWLPVVKSLILL
jgi:hypothetical protein